MNARKTHEFRLRVLRGCVPDRIRLYLVHRWGHLHGEDLILSLRTFLALSQPHSQPRSQPHSLLRGFRGVGLVHGGGRWLGHRGGGVVRRRFARLFWCLRLFLELTKCTKRFKFQGSYKKFKEKFKKHQEIFSGGGTTLQNFQQQQKLNTFRIK